MLAALTMNVPTVRNWLIALTLQTGMCLRPWRVSMVEGKIFYQGLTTSIVPRAFALTKEHTLTISTLSGNYNSEYDRVLCLYALLPYSQNRHCQTKRSFVVNKLVTDAYWYISHVIDLIPLLSLLCLRASFMWWSQSIATFSSFILDVDTWGFCDNFQLLLVMNVIK